MTRLNGVGEDRRKEVSSSSSKRRFQSLSLFPLSIRSNKAPTMSGTGPRENVCQLSSPPLLLLPKLKESDVHSPLLEPPLPLSSSVPTRMNLAVTKTRLKGAQTGHSLLKKKSDALNKVNSISLPFLSFPVPSLTSLGRAAFPSDPSENR